MYKTKARWLSLKSKMAVSEKQHASKFEQILLLFVHSLAFHVSTSTINTAASKNIVLSYERLNMLSEALLLNFFFVALLSSPYVAACTLYAQNVLYINHHSSFYAKLFFLLISSIQEQYDRYIGIGCSKGSNRYFTK